jgi:hypothetical protein
LTNKNNITNYYVFGHFPSSCFYLKHNISETGFSLCLQVKPNQLGPIVRASPYLWTKINKNRMMDNVQKLNICTNIVFKHPVALIYVSYTI